MRVGILANILSDKSVVYDVILRSNDGGLLKLPCVDKDAAIKLQARLAALIEVHTTLEVEDTW